MATPTKQNYDPAVKRGITFSEKSRIEACSKPPNSSRLRSIAAMISSGEPIQAAPLAI